TPTHHKCEHHGLDRAIAIGPRGARVVRWALARATGDRLWRIGTSHGLRLAVDRVNHEIEETWKPRQIRHAYTTRIGHLDLDGARAQNWHRHIDTTLGFLHEDVRKAIEIQRRHG